MLKAIDNSKGVLVVGYDLTHGKDKEVAIVSKRNKAGDLEIINAYLGEEATDLLKKLLEKKREKKDAI